MSEPFLERQYTTRTLDSNDSSESFLSRFKNKYPTDLDCTEALIRVIEPPNGFDCRLCKRKLPPRSYGHKMIRCRCGTRNFLLADSVFRNTRRPDAWWGYLYAKLTRHLTSTNGFARLFKTSPSTSHNIFGTYATVLKREMKTGKGVPSYEFIQIFIKRSKETEARKHPNSEELCMHSQSISETAKIAAPVQNQLPSDLTADEKTVMELISSNPVQADLIYEQARMPIDSVSIILSMLEIKGCIQRLPGDRWKREGLKLVEKKTTNTKAERSTVSPEVIEGFFKFVRDTRHGISRKYLQNNLAMFWHHVSTTRWSADALIAACRSSPPISSKEVFNDVTPALVKVCVRVSQVGKLHKAESDST